MAKPGQFSNLDSTGLRIVRRGCVVRFSSGATARVARVRTGRFFVAVPLTPVFTLDYPCSSVRVLSA